MKMLITLVILIVMLTGKSMADRPRQPMTFSLVPPLPGRTSKMIIQADGDFTPDTPVQFQKFVEDHDVELLLYRSVEVYFTSGGGDLRAGLNMGYLIRKYGFNTRLAAITPISEQTNHNLVINYFIVVGETCPSSPTPLFIRPQFRGFGMEATQADVDTCAEERREATHASYCISACTIAFLGGVHRFTTWGSIYAIHQFSAECREHPQIKICNDPLEAMAQSQQSSADLAVYLERMGIPESFLQEMASADPHHVNELVKWKMIQYHILTDMPAGH